MGLLVVVVDPDTPRRNGLAAALRRAGHTVVDDEAPGSAAVRPDVVVVHGEMPASHLEALTGRMGPQARIVVGTDRALFEIVEIERSRAPELALSQVVVDLRARTAAHPDRVEELTEKEAELLAFLAARSGQTVRREVLLEHVWGYRPDMQTRTVDNTVRRLRAKVEVDPAVPAHIHTVRGEGYRFEGEVVEVPPAPAEPTAILGREAELAQLDARVAAGVRCLTVLGAGGLGKSTLVREWVRRSGGTFVELAAARSAADVEALVRRALGTPRPVAEVLAARPSLVLVLDNVEQVPDVADLVATWLASSPPSVLVTTSRRRLGLAEERVLEVGPLDAEHGLALLLRTGRARRPSFASTPADEDHARAVVTLLEGIPLALELAGARAATMSPRDLLDRLQRSFRALRDRDRPDRHQSLRATLAWSWDLLSDDERVALARLCVFRGSFDLDAVEAVLGDDEPLDALIDHSLVRHARPVGGRTRFDMFDSVRELARDRARELGIEADAVARHAACFAALAPRIAAGTDGPDGWSALARLRAARLDILEAARGLPPTEAARTVLALRVVADVWRATPEEVAFLERLLPSLSPEEEADARYMIGAELAQQGGRQADALRHDTRSWEIACALGDAERICAARAAMGVALGKTGETAAAREAFGDAVASAPPSPSRARTLALVLFGVFERMYGSLDRARVLIDESLDEARRLGAPWLEVSCLSMAGSVALLQRRHSASLAASERALAIYRREGNLYDVVLELPNIGMNHALLGDPRRARAALEEAQDLAAELGLAVERGRICSQLSRVWLDLGEPERAVDELHRALEIQRRLGSPMDEAWARINLSCALRDLGRLTEAREAARAALDLALRLEAERAEKRARIELGRVAWLAGDLDEARQWFDEAGVATGPAELAAEYALLEAVRGDLGAAEEVAARAAAVGGPGAGPVFARCVLGLIRGDALDLDGLRAVPTVELAACAPAFEGGTVTRALPRLVRQAVAALAG